MKIYFYLFVLTLSILSFNSQKCSSKEMSPLGTLAEECNSAAINSILHSKDPIDISQMEPYLSAECEPLTTVADCVNAFSGHFFQVDRDLISYAIEPLHVMRFYDSGNQSESSIGFGCGLQFALWASDLQDSIRHSYAMISEREGVLVPYKTCIDAPREKKICLIDSRLIERGYTNLSQSSPSSHGNLVNRRAIHYKNTKDDYWKVQLGDGSVRIYDKRVKLEKEHQKRMDFPTSSAYLLSKEIKPNGNQLHFSYRMIHGKPRLVHLKTMNRTQTSTLNELNFSYTAEGCTVSNEQGDTVHYTYEEKPCNKYAAKVLTKVDSSQEGQISYSTQKKEGPRKITKVKKPNKNTLEVVYAEARTRFGEDRVTRLLEPLGENGKNIVTYQFSYHPNATHVQDAFDQLQVYHFDNNQRLVSREYIDSLGKTKRQDQFEWSLLPGQTGWLKSKSIREGNQLFHLKTYKYDKKGNVTRVTTYGNLTGQKRATFKKDQRKEMDQYSIEYAYTVDNLNLLAEVNTPEGLKTSYEYFPGTNLCTRVLHMYDGKIQERFFYGYDENGQLAVSIEDDGNTKEDGDYTGMTYRKIKLIDSIKVPGVSFGKPQQIREFYQDATGQVPLLNRTEFSYDTKGREIKQSVYNSHGDFCYETTKMYDEQGNVIQECNRLGHITLNEWDSNHNKIKEELFVKEGSSLREIKSLTYTYDLVGRLIRKAENHDHGDTFVSTYTYNALHQLISSRNAYEQETNYVYDRFGNQIQHIQPLMEDMDGNIFRPTINKKYNPIGSLLSETDARGFTTSYTYNAYGKPAQITYADGSTERMSYYSCGWLKQKWQADGTSAYCAYNPKGRLVKETWFDAQENLLKEEEYGYKGCLLRYKKNAMGILTTYTYDAAGRQIEENKGNLQIIRYAYDDFGRIIKIEKGEQCEVLTYDWDDRLTTKTWQDEGGVLFAKESYQYDALGNQISKTIWQSTEQTSCARAAYFSDGILNWKENPLGHRCTWQYNYRDFFNGFGQRMLYRVSLDPLKRSTYELEDAFQRVIKREILENDTSFSCMQFNYDAEGNPTKEEATVLVNGQPKREYGIIRTYNNRGLLESETEIPNGKITRFQYDAMGRLQRKQKPDGVFLHYVYDALGRLQALASSDHTVAYSYTYDLHDHLIQVYDHIHAITQKRTYDAWDRLLTEELGPNVIIYYEYDMLDRLTRMVLPDGSSVQYIYDAFHLKKINRCNAASQVVYTYECAEYDMQGHLLKSESPGGKIVFTYDALGRTIGIQGDQWSSYLEQFDSVGNLLHMRQTDPDGTLENSFQFDRLNQISVEKTTDTNQLTYDSLGNCLRKNEQLYEINDLNQLLNDGENTYTYDANGNLIAQSYPPITYTYDALNRLTSCNKEDEQTTFLYDFSGRCLQISDTRSTKHLLYQGEQEIGSLLNGKLREFRLVHPDAKQDVTFAIELGAELFFPIQDYRGNICALQKKGGDLAEWYRYSAFGSKIREGDLPEGVMNPWRFANRREVAELCLFTHRLYNPRIMRWQTADPLGFEDGLHLYHYAHNNPFYYKDLDGQFAIAIPIISWTFGAVLSPLIFPTLSIFATAAVTYSIYQLATYVDNKCNEVEVNSQIDEEKITENLKKKGRRAGKDNRSKGGPPRDPKTGNYLPDPAAEGAHTTLGIRKGRFENYTQGATFDEKGEFKIRTDVTSHGRYDHPKPHFHNATGPNGANTEPQPIAELW